MCILIAYRKEVAPNSLQVLVKIVSPQIKRGEMFKSGASMIEQGKQTDRARQTDGTSGQNVCNLHETKAKPPSLSRLG